MAAHAASAGEGPNRATMLLEAGVHPRMVAERLGHATPALVMNVYGHVTERMQREATAAMEAALGSFEQSPSA